MLKQKHCNLCQTTSSNNYFQLFHIIRATMVYTHAHKNRQAKLCAHRQHQEARLSLCKNSQPYWLPRQDKLSRSWQYIHDTVLDNWNVRPWPLMVKFNSALFWQYIDYLHQSYTKTAKVLLKRCKIKFCHLLSKAKIQCLDCSPRYMHDQGAVICRHCPPLTMILIFLKIRGAVHLVTE